MAINSLKPLGSHLNIEMRKAAWERDKGSRTYTSFDPFASAALACMVYPSGVVPGQEFTYQWNVSTDWIASGQGTRRITVNLIGAEAETIKAELEIGNLPLTCERKVSTREIRLRE